MRQNYEWFSTRYNFYDSSFADKEKTGVGIEKPIDFSYLRNAPHIKAITLENGNAFKKAKVDFSEYLNNVLEIAHLEYLEVKAGAFSNLVISKHILKSPLKLLSIRSAHSLELSFIGEIANLETLFLDIRDNVSLPREILNCTNLKNVKVSIAGGSIAPLYKLSSLEEVNLRVNDLECLETFSSAKIKDLSISCPLLKEMSTESVFSQLENFSLTTNESVDVPSVYFSDNVRQIRLSGKGIKPNFPKVMFSLESLKVTCQSLPALDAPALEVLHIESVGNGSLDEILGNMPNLEVLSIGSMKDFDCSLDGGKTPNLLKFQVGTISSVVTELDLTSQAKLDMIIIANANGICINLPKNNLGVVSLENIGNKTLVLDSMEATIVHPYYPGQSYLDQQRESNQIKLVKCELLEKIILSNAIRKVEVFHCGALKEIEWNGVANDLGHLKIVGCDKLQKLPGEILLSNDALQFEWTTPDYKIVAKDFVKILKDLCEVYNANTRMEIGKSIFENKIKFQSSALAALSIKSRTTFTLLERHLAAFSRGRIDFGALSLDVVEGKSICIAGKPHEKKTIIKEQVARLGMKYVSKVIDADYVIVCYTAEVVPNEHQIYLSESTFEDFCKKKKPRFLVASASEEHIRKLRTIMWSTDPQSENLALEMLKKGGLLDEVIGEAVVISKTSVDPSVRRRYKAFLKGKVNGNWLKIMSSNKRNNYWMSPEEKPDFLRAKVKRSNVSQVEFLRINKKDMDVRMDVVENYLAAEVLARPHYLQLPTLYKSELDYILNLPTVKGKLKRLFVWLVDGVPDNLGEHITLKELNLNCQNAETLPNQIYDLSRLSILNFTSDSLTYVDDKILNLKQLKNVVLRSKQTISLPGEIMEMPKLVKSSFSVGFDLR